jgi:3-hydroxybutyryl-CoA dehydratase
VVQGSFYEDLEVGDSVDLGGISICDAHIVHFCGVVGDFFPVHTDEVAAREFGFDRGVVAEIDGAGEVLPAILNS